MGVRIGELAKMAGCKVVTIRYYERQGLLKAPDRTEGNYRVYDDAEIARLKFIRHCRQHGMSLAEIKSLLAYMDEPTAGCGWINSLVKRHIADIDAQIAILEHLKSHLEALNRKCAGDQGGDCGILQSLAAGDICAACQNRARRADNPPGKMRSLIAASEN